MKGSSSFLVDFISFKCNVGCEMQGYFLHELSLSTMEGKMTKGCLTNVGRNLYKRKLNLSRPWQVSDLELLPEREEELIHVAHDGSKPLSCPECGRECPCYDHRNRRWRHLDSHGYQSYLVCEVPRVSCPEHGVVTVKVPWADRSGRFTAAFEAHVIDWLKETSVLAASRQLDLGWKAIYGIKARAVLRGLSRRESSQPVHVCVDETSFRKRHDYVTVVSDFTTGTVHFVGEGRRKSTLSGWYVGLSEEQLGSIESVSMDMWPAYINSTLDHVPGGDRKIAFDRFHVTRKMNEAVDKVRRQEHKALAREGSNDLKGTRYDWLTNHANMPEGQRRRFRQLRDSSLKTARAWAIKELGMSLWKYIHRGWALKAWNRWLSWATRCRLEPMKEVARMVREHLWGIINAVVLKVSNGPAESLNSRIKMIKVKSRGYRNRKRFITDIYFHLGGLDLYPEGVIR